MTNEKFVFFSAVEGKIAVSVDQVQICHSNLCLEIILALRASGVKSSDAFFTSSSIDFAHEYGFENADIAQELVDTTLQVLECA